MERIEVLKTYKMYIGGAFPRTESGRYYTPSGRGKTSLGNICLASRKDVRNSVVSARAAQSGWARKSAYNRSQILYRIGEMLEGRRAQFEAELVQQGSTAAAAQKEVETAIDRCIYYAGWCDKYQQVFSAVNPVSSAHFNFSVYEPIGVVAAIAPEGSSLIGLLSTILPVMAGGNACVILASHAKPLCAVTLGEVLASSDVPGGVVNILTGDRDELLPIMASHMDINAVLTSDLKPAQTLALKQGASHNLKRVLSCKDIAKAEDPYLILKAQEVKTTWHPIESTIQAGGAY